MRHRVSVLRERNGGRIHVVRTTTHPGPMSLTSANPNECRVEPSHPTFPNTRINTRPLMLDACRTRVGPIIGRDGPPLRAVNFHVICLQLAAPGNPTNQSCGEHYERRLAKSPRNQAAQVEPPVSKVEESPVMVKQTGKSPRATCGPDERPKPANR
jgi:hypothetical protein